MNIADLFKRLSHGALSSLSLSGDGVGTILVEKQPKIILYANEALSALHSKFVLRENDLLIQMMEGVVNYDLTSEHAVSNSNGHCPKYILDTCDAPFKDDIVKIFQVFDSDGREYPLNDVNDCSSVFTPRFNKLQVPNPMRGHTLSVVYQARHNELQSDLRQEIELPFVLEPALFNHIAASVFMDIGTQESIVKSQLLMAKYESLCIEVEEKDLVNTSISTSNSKFNDRGWV